MFDTPIALELNLPSEQIYVLDETQEAVFAVDWNNGDRTILADGTHGSGPALTAPLDISMNVDETVGYVLTGTSGTIVAVDLTTGDRQAVSSGCVAGARELWIDGTRAIVSSGSGIYQVDLVGGGCTVMSSGAVGQGPLPLENVGLFYDIDHDSVFALSSSLGALLMIDIPTGDRLLVSK